MLPLQIRLTCTQFESARWMRLKDLNPLPRYDSA
jgi:hypothetical protein